MSAVLQAAQAVGRFSTSTALSAVPPEVVTTARHLLLDTFGVLLGGLRYPAVRSVATELAVPSPEGDHLPFGRLFVLGTAATWLDADSGGSFHPQGHRLPPVPTAHPAPHSLPALLSLAAARNIVDGRLLEVFLVANEIGMRTGVASSLRPGMHPHGVHGPAAAALVSTLLSGGSADTAAHAFLLASSLPLAATLQVPMSGGTVRNAWTGLGAYYGACAARWAAAGSTADPDAYPALFGTAVCTDLSLDAIAGGLGSHWEIANSYLKPYACARWIHPALDALTAAMAAGPVAAQDVLGIDVDTFAFAAQLDAVDVRSDMHARFSLPYCLATHVVDGGLYADAYLPDRLHREEVSSLARRVTVREDARSSAALPTERPARVRLHLRDGRELVGEVRNARGNPASPLSPAELERKFRRNVGDLLPDSHVDAVLERLLEGRQRRTSTLADACRVVLRALEA